ncbi:hypothetical protein DM02DRAFT_655342 [Periconia macrospinosa]|uniref:Cytochrome P450 n=1 Tax=Periconia macrospinosa TaxID=97972 RepID=A0A2V1DRJ6_9PLEO|nr:hypothetical protein DM02DRAFT_655342 [Periconia macrospinosa]
MSGLIGNFRSGGRHGVWKTIRNVKQSRANLFLGKFQRVGIWRVFNQVFKRFTLLHPLVWPMLPPRVVLTVPTLLRMNRDQVRVRMSAHLKMEHNNYINVMLLIAEKSELPTEDWVLAQANVLIVAGFDPMTNLFSSVYYYLLKTSRP